MKKMVNTRRVRGFVTLLVYAAFLTACGDGSEPLVPAAVEVVAGDGQSAPVGGTLPVAPSVKVVTSKGKAVPNVKVTFTAAAGNGVVMGGAQVTNGSGVATVTSWTLGTKSGPSTLTVTAEGVNPITITANTTAGPATAAVAVAGTNQSSLVGTPLQVAPSVQVTDVYGNPVSGAEVSFTLQNGGSLQAPRASTDAGGLASPGQWTLGTGAGGQILLATVSGSTATPPVVIIATAIPDVAAQFVVSRQPAATNGSGQRLSIQPELEFRDRYGNVATSASLPVTASLASGTGALGGTTTVNAQAGRVRFTDLTYTGTGVVQLRFSTVGFQEAVSSEFTIMAAAPCEGPTLALNYTVGQSARFLANAPGLPRCLNFSAATNVGQQYLVMFENLSPRGSYGTAVFPGTLSDDGVFGYTVETRSTAGSQKTAPVASLRQVNDAPPQAVHGWDFGGQRVYEIEPKPLAGVTPTALVRRDGNWISTSSVRAAIAVGDTLQIMMEGISRLGIGTRLQRAIVRLVTPDIVIAEDVRIVSGDTTFKRSSGSLNTSIAQADLEEIASEYAQYAKVMADRFFANGHNAATTQDPGRPIAVHSLMSADNIWGYTYSNTNYFVWDYWVASNGSIKGLPQHAQRNADDLFMHEIAHMRHFGLLERSGRTALRGNRWLVEGFARFSERLPIAMRLLNTANLSRTQNVTLPFNPAFRAPDGRYQYYYDDVPTYLQASFSMYEGYGASGFVFDYFADQVAQSGGDWWTALSDLLINAGSEADVNAVVNRYLPGLDFGTLFTRARVALYTDDYDAAGLPAWTQYSMYNLRASRPPSGNAAQLDPRNLFPRIVPGTSFAESRGVSAGAAFGYVIDGAAGAADVRIDITPAAVVNGVVTIVRIK